MPGIALPEDETTCPTTEHCCHARGCEVAVPPEKLMCFNHWRMVPRQIQQAVWANYRLGQCNDKRPSLAWLQAADAAIGYVARLERKPNTRVEVAALEAYDNGQISRPSAVRLPDLISRRVEVRRRYSREESVAGEDEEGSG